MVGERGEKNPGKITALERFYQLLYRPIDPAGVWKHLCVRMSSTLPQIHDHGTLSCHCRSQLKKTQN